MLAQGCWRRKPEAGKPHGALDHQQREAMRPQRSCPSASGRGQHAGARLLVPEKNSRDPSPPRQLEQPSGWPRTRAGRPNAEVAASHHTAAND